MIDTKVRFGRWRQVHKGVYATFTGPITPDARLWAAVLYAGQGAYLSHRTRGRDQPAHGYPSLAIDVTVPASRRVSRLKMWLSICRRTRPWFGGAWEPPPYTIAEETVIDLVQAATDKDDVIALVTSGFTERSSPRAPQESGADPQEAALAA